MKYPVRSMLFWWFFLASAVQANTPLKDFDRLTNAEILAEIDRLNQPSEVIEVGEKLLSVLEARQGEESRKVEPRLLSSLAWAHGVSGQSEQAERYARRAESLARSLQDPEELGIALEMLSNIFFQKNEPEIARRLLEESVQIFEQLPPSGSAALTILSLANLDHLEKRHAEAILRLHQAHRIAEQGEDYWPLEKTTAYLSAHYLEMGQTERALELAREGIARQETPSADALSGVLHLAVCRAQSRLGDFDEAVANCLTALKMAQATDGHFLPTVERIHGELADLLLRVEQPDRAQSHLDQALAIQALNSTGYEASRLLTAARLQEYRAAPETESSIRRALQMAQQMKDEEVEEQALQMLANLLSKKGDHEKALEIHRAFFRVATSRQQKLHTLAVAEQHAQLEMTLKEQRIRSLENEKALDAVKLGALVSSRRTLTLGAGLAFLAIVLVHARFRLRVARRQLSQDEQHKEDLRHQVKERTSELKAERDKVIHQADQLQQLDQAKSELFANVSHELRTPLTLTLGAVQDLRAGLFGRLEEKVDEQLAGVQQSSGRLLELVNQLLDVAKLESGRLVIHPTPLDVCAFSGDLIQSMVPWAEREGVELRYESRSELSQPLYFDPEMLTKILSNLVGNALKFTPKGGVVSVMLERPSCENGSWLTLMVRDNGPGIKAEYQEEIFDRFYQVEGSSTRRWSGSGLGLSLARDLVDLHGGRIDIESEVGFGATFTVWLQLGTDHFSDAVVFGEPSLLPSTLPTAQPAPSAPALDDEAQLDEDRTTILVVDDHSDVRAYLRRHLTPIYRVLEASNGRQALAKAEAQLPDLVVSDVMMPEMDGNELCRQLKSHTELDYVPVILLTARADDTDRIAGLELGADDYLAKPFDMRELLARIANLVASRRKLLDHTPALQVPSLETEQGPSTDQAFVDRVWHAISNGLEDENFNVDQLAQTLSIDRSHLYRRLQAVVGSSPSELIRTLRLQHAESLLRTQAGSVSEIAYQVGFRSVSQFSRCFRKIYGVPPSSFLSKDSNPTPDLALMPSGKIAHTH